MTVGICQSRTVTYWWLHFKRHKIVLSWNSSIITIFQNHHSLATAVLAAVLFQNCGTASWTTLKTDFDDPIRLCLIFRTHFFHLACTYSPGTVLVESRVLAQKPNNEFRAEQSAISPDTIYNCTPQYFHGVN